jgi:hypothetical protein
VSSRLRFLVLGGEAGAAGVVGSRIVVSEVVSSITDMGFDRIMKFFIKEYLYNFFRNILRIFKRRGYSNYPY